MSFKSTDRLSNRIRLDVIRSNQKIWNAQTSTNQNCLKLGILPSHWLSDGIIDITHKSDDTSHHSCTKIRKLQVIRHSIDRMMLSHILTGILNGRKCRLFFANWIRRLLYLRNLSPLGMTTACRSLSW